MKTPFSTSIAIATGLIVLVGYFLPFGLFIGFRVVLLEWAVILAAVALLVGLINLISVHWRKVISNNPNRLYSLVLLTAFILTIGIVGWFGPTHTYSLWLFNYIQLPVESSLMAILSILLVMAIIRLLTRRSNLVTFLFTLVVVIVLIPFASISGVNLKGLTDLKVWLTEVIAVAGARGILLGVALGILAMGLRLILGVERPYRQ